MNKNTFDTNPLLSSLNETVSGAAINTSSGTTNCYYCTVAFFAGKDVLDLVSKTEIMQQDGANFGEINTLFREAGLTASVLGPFDDFAEVIKKLHKMSHNSVDCAISFTRRGQIGHMVVLLKRGLVLTLHDAQSGETCDGDEKILNYLARNNGVQYWIWFVGKCGLTLPDYSTLMDID